MGSPATRSWRQRARSKLGRNGNGEKLRKTADKLFRPGARDENQDKKHGQDEKKAPARKPKGNLY